MQGFSKKENFVILFCDFEKLIKQEDQKSFFDLVNRIRCQKGLKMPNEQKNSNQIVDLG